MYRLQFVYSDGTDDFDYWDEIETYDHEFETPLVLVETFIEMAKRHPQIEHYKIMDPQYKEPMQSIYHFILENFKDQECYDLADRIYEVTKQDWEQYNKFFGPVKTQTVKETCDEWIKMEPISEEEKELAKKFNKKFTVDVSDLNTFDMEWIIRVLDQQVTNLDIQENGHIKMFIQKLRKVRLDKHRVARDSKEYQEYLRLKEKFEGKQNG